MSLLKKAGGIATIVAASLAVGKIIQNKGALTLFKEDHRIGHFQNMNKVMPSTPVYRSNERPFTFKKSERNVDPLYVFKGEERSLHNLLDKTTTTGFIVIKDDEIVQEDYFRGSDESSTFTSWSVAKSMISSMIGILLSEGKIKSLHDPITDYVPALKTSGYKDVPIEHVLLMASGVRFNEDYDRRFSDIKKVFYHTLVLNRSVDKYMKQLPSERMSGRLYKYVSMDTQALGMLIRSVTGKQPSKYFEEKVWQEIGTEADAFWSQDRRGNDLSFCGFNATLRDYARFGRLYLHEGNWEGTSIIPSDWVRASTKGDSETTLRKQKNLGYKYQWWVPYHENQDFLALGVWGQFIYVHPEQKTIIVKTSVDPDFEKHEAETIAAFRQIAEQK